MIAVIVRVDVDMLGVDLWKYFVVAQTSELDENIFDNIICSTILCVEWWVEYFINFYECLFLCQKN